MNQRKELSKQKLFLAFIIPIVGMMILNAVNGFFPFGHRSVVIQDMFTQYISIVSFMKRAFLHPSMLLYSSQIGLGTNTWPMFAYYGSSPFTLIALFFPTSYLPFFFELDMLASAGLIGLTTYVCLVRSHILNNKIQLSNINPIWPITISSVYALSGYFANYNICVMWTNTIILFPIIMLAWEKIIMGGQVRLYLITLTAAIFLNYYIGIIIVEYLFVVSVFGLFYLLLKKQLFQRANLLIILKLTISTLLAIVMNCFVLLPSFVAQKQVDQAPFVLTLRKAIGFHELLNNFFPLPSSTEIPVLYAGIVAIPLVILYFFIRQINWQEKVISFLLIAFLLISTVNLSLYMVWHMFSMHNGLFQREGFVILFSILALAYRSLGLMLSNYQVSKWGWICFVIIMTVLTVEAYISLFHNINVSLLIRIVGIVMMMALIFFTVKTNHKLIYLIFGIAFADILFSAQPLYNLNKEISLSWQPYMKYAKDSQKTIDYLNHKDGTFYRIGTNTEFNRNANMLFGYADISGYISQLSRSETNYLSQLGYYQKHSWYRWANYNNGSTLAINRLLGYKYYLVYRNPELLISMSKNRYLKYSFTNQRARFIKKTKSVGNNYQLATDPEAASLVIPANKAIFNDTQINYDPSKNPFDYFNRLIEETTGVKHLYRSINVRQHYQSANRAVYDAVSDGQMTYMYIPTAATDDIKQIKVYVNGQKVTTAYGNHAEDENGIICLGSHPAGNTIHIRLEGPGVKQAGNVIFRSEGSSNMFDSRREVNKIVEQNNRIEFTTTKANSKRNFLITMANANGWHARVDGQKVPVYQAAGGMMGIKLPSKGVHHVQLVFIPPKLRLGTIISVIALLISAMFVKLVDQRKKFN